MPTNQLNHKLNLIVETLGYVVVYMIDNINMILLFIYIIVNYMEPLYSMPHNKKKLGLRNTKETVKNYE